METEEYVATGLIVAAFFGGWFFNGYRWEAKMNELKTEYATALQTSTDEAKKKEEEHAYAISEIDNKHTKELENARNEIDRLRSDVAAGSVRLLVNARCGSDVSKTGSGSSMGDAASPRLERSAEQNYYALVSGIETVTAQLKACQDIVRQDRE